jgi:hypothetical protein
VTGLVTPVPSFNVVVAPAIAVRATQQSPARFWLSTTPMPSQPLASASVAKRIAWRGDDVTFLQNSMTVLRRFCCLGSIGLGWQLPQTVSGLVDLSRTWQSTPLSS